MDELKEALKERLSHVFFGTIVLSWSVWNWRVWVVLTSGLQLDQKLPAVQKQLDAAHWACPIAASFGYAYFLMPVMTLWGKQVKTWTDNRLSAILSKSDKTAPTNWANAKISAARATATLNNIIQWYGNAVVQDPHGYPPHASIREAMSEVFKIVRAISAQDTTSEKELRNYADRFREEEQTSLKKSMARLGLKLNP